MSQDREMTREEELKAIQKYIEEHGATRLPPDERIKMHSSEAWKLPYPQPHKRKKKKKV